MLAALERVVNQRRVDDAQGKQDKNNGIPKTE